MNVKVASAQYPVLYHQSLQAWEAYVEKWIAAAVQEEAQLLLFPEYASMELVSLFPGTIQKDIALQLTAMQDVYPDFCTFFAVMAQKYAVIIVAPSFPVAEGSKVYNRACVFGPNGFAGFQDKFFMTRFENEDWQIHTPPKVLTLFEASWGSFGMQTCYDIEFAIGSKLLCEAGASLILVPSCTETMRGATRVHIGARARAMENQCYTVVSQTVGNALWSPAVDINFGFAGFYATPDKGFPEEGVLHTGTPQEEKWEVAALDFTKIQEVRNDGQVLNFRDHQPLSYRFSEGEIIVEKKPV